jgi:hypothetical protein
MNPSQPASGLIYPCDPCGQANPIVDPWGGDPGNLPTAVAADGRLIESLHRLIDFVNHAKNSKTRGVASILVALWNEDRVVPHLQWVAMLEPATFEHILNVLRLVASGIPLERLLGGGADVFEEIIRTYHFKRSIP